MNTGCSNLNEIAVDGIYITVFCSFFLNFKYFNWLYIETITHWELSNTNSCQWHQCVYLYHSTVASGPVYT